VLDAIDSGMNREGRLYSIVTRLLVFLITISLPLIVAACAQSEPVVIERIVVATPTPAPTAAPTPTPTATPVPTNTPAPTATPTPTKPTVVELVEMARAYVVRIDRPDGACASGILLGEDRLILTNYHVVEGTDSLGATTDDGTIAEARVFAFDVDRDLALLQAQSTIPEPPPVVWADDAAMSVGEQLVVIGYPFPGSSSPDDCSETITTTGGLLSGRLEILGQPYLQTDAALNPGVSGGAAISDVGEVAGIAVSGLGPEFAENVGFLIPAHSINERLDQWLQQLVAGSLDPPALIEQIAFVNSRDGTNIYVMDADGSNVRQLTVGSINYGPAWSPDGTQIAFGSGRDDEWKIYVMDADGSNVRKLMIGSGSHYRPAWSPDGSRIAFDSYRDGDNWDIYVMDADGSNVRQLTTDSRDSDPAWSPDGTRIAFARLPHNGDNWGIYVMDADGSNVRKLMIGPAHSPRPVWSPDGSRIAFHASRDGDLNIYVMDADGSNVRLLTTGSEDEGNYSPTWTLVSQRPSPAPRPPTPAPTPTPAIPPQLLAWLDVWEEFRLLAGEMTRREIEILDRVTESGGNPFHFIDEWRDLEDWYRGDEGPYGFVYAGRFSRFLEVRSINDRISLYVEARLQEQGLYIRHLETGDRALFDQSDAQRIQNNHEWKQLKDFVEDLKADFGL